MAIQLLGTMMLAMLKGISRYLLHFAQDYFTLLLSVPPEPEPQPAPQPQQSPRVVFNDLPCEIKTQIFRELLVLRYKQVPLRDESADYDGEDAFACTEAGNASFFTGPSHHDCRGLFHMDETILRPQTQPMHPQLLCICRQWYEIGRRILIDENPLFALVGESRMRGTDDLERLAEKRGLFYRKVSAFGCSARPVMTLRTRRPPRALLLFDMVWAPAIIRHIAMNRLRSARANHADGIMVLNVHVGPITAFRAPSTMQLLHKLWTEEVFPLLAGSIELKLCLLKGKHLPGTVLPLRARSFPDNHNERLLATLIERQREEIRRTNIPSHLPEASLCPVVATINTFLTDLHTFHCSNTWPSKRYTSSFELECARIHGFLSHLDIARRNLEIRQPLFRYMCDARALFDLLLGLLTCNATLPGTFRNLAGSTPAQRLAAGRAMLRFAQGLHQVEEQFTAHGLIDEPRCLLRSYASVMSALDGVKGRSATKGVAAYLRQAYFLLIPGDQQFMAEAWLSAKEEELMGLVLECGTVVLQTTPLQDINHWWESGVWVPNVDVEKFRVLMMKHWETTRMDAGLDGDVFAVPSFGSEG